VSYCTECGAPLDAQHQAHDSPVTRRSSDRRTGLQYASFGLSGLALVLAIVAVALTALGGNDLPAPPPIEQAARQIDPSVADEEVEALQGRIDELETVARELSTDVELLESMIPDVRLTVPEIADLVLRSVVTVKTPSGLGTGFAIEDPSGDIFIITNYHVVASVWASGGRTVTITQDGEEFEGRIANVSATNDLAAIESAARVPALETSNDQPIIGDGVVVIGSPYGLDGTVVTGIVSALRSDHVQFSAPVSPGNSGGPLIDGNGMVIGVVVSKVSSRDAEGLSFAIPMSVVCSVVVAC